MLQSLNVALNVSGVSNVSDLLADVKIHIAYQTFYPTTITPVTGTTAIATFDNLNIVLPADSYIPFTVFADIAQDTGNMLDGATVSITWNVQGTSVGTTNNPQIIDVNYNNEAVLNPGTFTSSTMTFTSGTAAINNESTAIGSAIMSNSVVVGYNVSFQFTMTAGNNPVYVSSMPFVLTGATSGQDATLTLLPNGVVVNPANLPGDANGYYMIPAGSSRQFTLNGTITSYDGVIGLKTAWIPAINYGLTTTNVAGYTISYGLQSLHISVTF